MHDRTCSFLFIFGSIRKCAAPNTFRNIASIHYLDGTSNEVTMNKEREARGSIAIVFGSTHSLLHHDLLSRMYSSPVNNVLFLADSYKLTHHRQYPPGTTSVYSYFESRGGKYDEICFFGLQYVIKRWLTGPVVNHEMIAQAKVFYQAHFGGANVFNDAGWTRIVEKHNGCLPLRIKAVPEGTVVPVKNVLFTVENTDPEFPWLTNWFETLLVQVWYPMTVCTTSREMKKTIGKYLVETADSIDGLPFKLHDFGYRGSTSVESAAIGGAAHLVNFVGTDTVAGLQLCSQYYGSKMAGFSIPATEHSTITTWRRSGEADAFRNMLEQYPEGVVSVVSDSYDVYNAVANIWGDELKDLVLERANKGCLVIRPDSGDPCVVVVKLLNLLAEKFPITCNSKGYRVLPSYLRLIQGDGIKPETIGNILESIKCAGWSTENIVFGAGGALLQRMDRDTQKCAFKCSSVVVDGHSFDVFKDPTTDTQKRSKKGRLTLERRSDGQLVTVQEGFGDPSKDIMVTVFENGELKVDYSLDEIRTRAELAFVQEIKKMQEKEAPINSTIMAAEVAA
uniref:Nicotinamide phosphoribosyltransferase n=2 Tax=Steinernema glaseri TaxID=37863 RepID=A0A1I7ZIS1_9BILA